MKKIINYIITFIIMILLIILTTFIIYQKEISTNKFIKNLNKINYYQKSYSNILKEIDEYIINIDLKNDIINYYTQDKAKQDTINIINNKNIDHYDNLKEIISKHTKDDNIINEYANQINTKIINNLFMNDEYNYLTKTRLNTNDTLFIIFIIIIIITILLFTNYIITKKIDIQTPIFSLGLFLLIPKLFLITTNILNNFMYTNTYFSELILLIINNIVNTLFIFGLFITIIIIYLNYKLKH